MDNRSPERLYDAKFKEGTEISNFLSELIGNKDKGLTKLVTEELQADAKREAGKLLAQQDVSDVPLQEQPRWREINPRVQSEFLAVDAQRRTRLYGEIYNAEISTMDLLLEPSEGNPELQAQQARLKAQAAATAREKSGVSELTPYLQMQNAPQAMQYTAAVDGQVYKGRAERADERQQSRDVNLVSSAIEAYESDAPVLENSDDRVAGLRQTLQQQVDRLGGTYSAETVANIVARAITEQLPGIIQSKDDLNLTLSDLKQLGSQELLVNGQNIWDTPGKNGKSLRLRLNEAIEAAGDQRDDRLIGMATQEALSLVQAGDVDGAIDTITSAGLDVSNPANVKLITQAFSTIKDQTTLVQDGAQMEFWNRNVRGESWKDMWSEIVQAGKDQGVSARFVEGIGKRILSGEDDGGSAQTNASINLAYTQLARRGESGLAENAVKRAASKVGVTAGSQLEESLLLQLRGKYAQIVEAKVQADPTYDIAGNMSEDLKEATAFLVDGLTGGLKSEVYRSTVGPEKAAAALTAFRQGAASTSGQLSDALFTEDVTELAKTISGNDTPTIKDKTKALVSLLTSVQNPDGTLLFPNREAAIKAVRDALNAGKEQRNGFEPLSWLLHGGNIKSEIPRATAIEADKVLREAGVEPKEDGTNSEEVGTTLTETSLRSLGGSLDPEAKLLNPEGYRALAGALVNGRTVGLDTALPQLDPETPARIIPAFFGSQNDEMFVAIGIAEGTRTPGGGYTRAWNGHTDPGDGHMNRGTVSGGRGNRLSPMQVDRQWRGILAQTATNVRPVLRQIGLEPGTVAHNNVLFSALDLRVQAPAAVGSYLQNIAASKDFTLEGIAKARADAFINPQTGRLDTTFSSYTVLLRDQRSRAGALQFRRRV